MTEFRDLPVYRHKDDILRALEENQVIVVESPTGSGKTTQLPLILKEAGYDESGIIGVTQPRRIAALSICDFIKRQLGIEDNYCAYTMRFADTSDDSTRIKVMTDGILLQELKSDRFLSRYSVMMVDEAHERSLNIDFILGLLKEVISVRKDLKVIISSATINTRVFSEFFGGAKIISIDAKVYPVEVIYTPPREPERSYYERETDTDTRLERIYEIVEKWLSDEKGDVLIFLPGEAEIIACVDMLQHSPFSSLLEIYPLYGRLSREEQEKVFTPTGKGKTKVVVSTNIAETSITIDGIRCVIDSGLAKVNYYDQKTFTSSLIPQPISRASAEQRKGRAGRTQSGFCYRLYTKKNFESREEYSKEEITRSDLAEVALRMSDLAIYDYANFPFITAPRKSALASAEYTLKLLGAIDDEHHLTPTGEKMVLFPLLPRLSRCIVESIMKYPSVLSEVLIAVSFLSTKGPFLFPKDKAVIARARQEKFQDSAYGDFAGYLKLFDAYSEVTAKDEPKAREKFCKYYFLDIQTMNEIVHIKKQLEEIVSSMGIPVTGGGEKKDYLISLASGLIQFVCALDDYNSYRSLTVDEIYIHPSCSWFRIKPSYILAGEIVQTSRMFARSVSPLKPDWIDIIRPNLREMLKYTYSRGYESIEEDYRKGLEKKEKKAAKLAEKRAAKEEKNREHSGKKGKNKYVVFGRTLSSVGANKQAKKRSERDEAYYLNIKALPSLANDAFAAGRVPKIKIILTSSQGETQQALPLKTYIQEAKLLEGKKQYSSFTDEYFTIEEDAAALASKLKTLFSICRIGESKYFGFLSLMRTRDKEGGYKIYVSSSLPSAVDTTFASLSEITETTGGSRKKYASLHTAASKLLDRISSLEGLDE